MKKIFRKIFAVLAVALILFPSVAKFEHHHEHFTHPDDVLFTKAHSHDCPICKFEFSSFLEHETFSIPEKPIKHGEKLTAINDSEIFLPQRYLFSLRAPPFSLDNFCV